MIDMFEEPELWERIIVNNARAIARRLVESGVVTITRDYVIENGEVIFGLELHEALSS